MMERDLEFIGDVIRRLIAKLDELAQPTIGIERVTGERVEMRDWMMLHCFGEDHELYDDVMAALGMARPRVPDRRYPVGLTRAEVEALRTLLSKAEHAVRNSRPEGEARRTRR